MRLKATIKKMLGHETRKVVKIHQILYAVTAHNMKGNATLNKK